MFQKCITICTNVTSSIDIVKQYVLQMRVLYLFSKNWFEGKMSLGRLKYAQALSRLPGVELRIWGLGWEGYNPLLSVKKNLENDGWEPTHLWIYKAQEYRDLDAIGLPRLVVFNEAYDYQETCREIAAAAATHLIFHHQNDFNFWKQIFQNSFHLPHAAEIYEEHVQIADRLVPSIVTGNLDARCYPLRRKMANLVRYRLLPGHVRKHPGYTLQGSPCIEYQYQSYRFDLQSARIGLGCSSIKKYNLARFVELAMAGTVIVTDLPDDDAFKKYFGDSSIIIPDGASYLKIRSIILSESRDLQGLQQRSNQIRSAAVKHLSFEIYVSQLKEILCS